jgi:hypothetical protein
MSVNSSISPARLLGEATIFRILLVRHLTILQLIRGGRSYVKVIEISSRAHEGEKLMHACTCTCTCFRAHEILPTARLITIYRLELALADVPIRETRWIRTMCSQLKGMRAKLVTANALRSGRVIALVSSLSTALYFHQATSLPSTFSFTVLRGGSKNVVVRQSARHPEYVAICVYRPAYEMLRRILEENKKFLNPSSTVVNHMSEIAIGIGLLAHSEVGFCPDDILQFPKPWLLFFPLGETLCMKSASMDIFKRLLKQIADSRFIAQCGSACFSMVDLWGKHVEAFPNAVLLHQHSYATNQSMGVQNIGGAREAFRTQYAAHHSNIIIPYLEFSPKKVRALSNRKWYVYLRMGKRQHTLGFRTKLLTAFHNYPTSLKEGRFRGISAKASSVEWIGENIPSRSWIVDEMSDSVFCLIPRGDSDDSLRLFTALSAGCIPVILSDWLMLPFEDQIPYHKFGLFFRQQQVEEIPGFLYALNESTIEALFKNMLKYRRHVMYRSKFTDVRPNEAIDHLVRAMQKRAAILSEYYPWFLRTENCTSVNNSDTPQCTR